MADLKDSIASQVKLTNPATDPLHAVRKTEYDAALAARPTTEVVGSTINAAQAEAALTVADTASVLLNLSGTQLTASVNTGPGLVIGSNLVPDFGTGNSNVARGDHTHGNDHVAATGGTTDTAVVSVDGDQVISINVALQSGGHLVSTVDGVGVETGYFSASTHSHNLVTGSTPGFMSAAMLLQLNSLAAETPVVFSDSGTVHWNSDGDADVKLATGLVEGGSGVEVDFGVVAPLAHTHNYQTAFTPSTNTTGSSTGTIHSPSGRIRVAAGIMDYTLINNYSISSSVRVLATINNNSGATGLIAIPTTSQIQFMLFPRSPVTSSYTDISWLVW